MAHSNSLRGSEPQTSQPDAVRDAHALPANRMRCGTHTRYQRTDAVRDAHALPQDGCGAGRTRATSQPDAVRDAHALPKDGYGADLLMAAFGGHYQCTNTRLLQDAKRLKRASTANNTGHATPWPRFSESGRLGGVAPETETETDIVKTARSLH